MRANIAALPDGSYSCDDFLDNDGVTDKALRIALDLTIAGDRMRLDFSRSAPPCDGPLNIAYSTTVACCYVALKHLFTDVPANAGCLAPIEFVIPDTTLLAVSAPRPVGGYTETILRVIDVIFGAFAKAAPERANGSPFATINALSLAGWRAHGRRWVMFCPPRRVPLRARPGAPRARRRPWRARGRCRPGRRRRPAWRGGCTPSSRPAAASANSTPAVSSEPLPPGSASSEIPRPARAIHRPSSGRREPITASSSGPVNSIVTATPSGIRAHRLVDHPVHAPPAPRRTQRRGAGRVPARGYARAPDGTQDHGGEGQPQERGSGGAQLVEQRDRERASDLDGGGGREHHADGNGTAGGRCHAARGISSRSSAAAVLRSIERRSGRVSPRDPRRRDRSPACSPGRARVATAPRAGSRPRWKRCRPRRGAPSCCPRAAGRGAARATICATATASPSAAGSRPSGAAPRSSSTPRCPTPRSSCWRASPAPTASSTRRAPPGGAVRGHPPRRARRERAAAAARASSSTPPRIASIRRTWRCWPCWSTARRPPTSPRRCA